MYICPCMVWCSYQSIYVCIIWYTMYVVFTSKRLCVHRSEIWPAPFNFNAYWLNDKLQYIICLCDRCEHQFNCYAHSNHMQSLDANFKCLWITYQIIELCSDPTIRNLFFWNDSNQLCFSNVRSFIALSADSFISFYDIHRLWPGAGVDDLNTKL